MRHQKDKRSRSFDELPPNPFDGRHADEVWKELYVNSKPVSREEVMRRYQEKKLDHK